MKQKKITIIKDTNMKIKNISVGDYVHLETWKPGDPLYSPWKKDYADEFGEKFDPDSLDPEEMILPAGEYTLFIDYPLSIPFKHKRNFDNPVSREEVVKWIVDCYHGIYATENSTTAVKTDDIPGMLNRNTTNGTYGIWGHSLDDLDLHTIHIDEDNLITLGVDS